MPNRHVITYWLQSSVSVKHRQLARSEFDLQEEVKKFVAVWRSSLRSHHHQKEVVTQSLTSYEKGEDQAWSVHGQNLKKVLNRSSKKLKKTQKLNLRLSSKNLHKLWMYWCYISFPLFNISFAFEIVIFARISHCSNRIGFKCKRHCCSFRRVPRWNSSSRVSGRSQSRRHPCHAAL